MSCQDTNDEHGGSRKGTPRGLDGAYAEVSILRTTEAGGCPFEGGEHAAVRDGQGLAICRDVGDPVLACPGMRQMGT